LSSIWTPMTKKCEGTHGGCLVLQPMRKHMGNRRSSYRLTKELLESFD
jgi:hypothetical protein